MRYIELSAAQQRKVVKIKPTKRNKKNNRHIIEAHSLKAIANELIGQKFKIVQLKSEDVQWATI